MLSRGVALKFLHSQLLTRRQIYCSTSWQERFRLSYNRIQSDGYQLIFRQNSTGKKPEPVPAKPLERPEEKAVDSKIKAKEELLLKQISENTAIETKSSSATAAATTTSENTKLIADLPTDTKPSVSTKTIEIKTSKGILSVTTTIEDSKINDVIMEKTSASKAALVPPLPVAKVSKAEMLKEAAKKLTVPTVDEAKVIETKKLTEAAAEGVKKVMDVLKSPVTQKTEETVPPANVATQEAHVLEVKTKKKTINATVKAMEKLAQSTGQSKAEQAKVDTAAPLPKPKVKSDSNRSSLERNFITPSRAMSDFLLTPMDLENLPKIKRRSPYEQEPPITVFWRRDVESKAIEIWGSREKLLTEQLKRDVERKKHQQNIFTVKRRLRDYRREIGSRTILGDTDLGLKGESGKVVLIAVGINGMNFLFKVIGWLYTGSHSMFAECIHSLADTINQLILAYGIHKSQQHADPNHPYGYANWKYVSSLISGVGIFCVGTGLSIYHGITGLLHPEPLEDLYWAFFILGGSLISEGATLLVAMKEIKRSAAIQKVSFREYVLSGRDPCVNVVLMEDAAAVSSVGVAFSCMGLTYLTGNPVYDAVGSLFVGGILGAVASFIIYTNTAALVGRSINEEHLERINAELESDVMIRAIHDVKGIDMGNSLVRYKAEMDFDGRELTRSYLDKQDLTELLKIVKSFQTVEELEQFLLNHGENIVDLMGGEIDRIEMKLRKKFPEIRHCDLEIL